ncbi:unnamed protein product, partial [Linum tenue]
SKEDSSLQKTLHNSSATHHSCESTSVPPTTVSNPDPLPLKPHVLLRSFMQSLAPLSTKSPFIDQAKSDIIL